jgi:hypothetical protein
MPPHRGCLFQISPMIEYRVKDAAISAAPMDLYWILLEV